MTENEKLVRDETEAIECLKSNKPTSGYLMLQESIDMAIKALEEVQHWHTSVINPKIKNVFANTSTQICHNCDHKDEYIEELEAEVEEYRTIGTPEECRAAMEKQTAISRELIEGKYFCPKCHNLMPYPGYCRCGQKVY